VRRFVFLLTLSLIGIAAAAPAAERPPAIVAPGVVVGDLPVGRLTSEQARTRIRVLYGRGVRFTFGSRHWYAPAAQLGAKVGVDDAVTVALNAQPRAHVAMPVRIDLRKARRYVAALDARFSYAAQDAHAYLVGTRPAISAARSGLAVRREQTVRSVASALRTALRRQVTLATRLVAPTVTAANFGPIIVIERGSNQLALYQGTQLVRTFKVATGRAQYPTPLGSYSIVDKQRNPWWRPPSSDWAKGLQPIPPGPGNPLGTRWMGTSAPGVGIHGTPDAASVGYSASHGCIRMYVPDAEWLFEHVNIGTPVFIVGA
jgi:lipoprotein-anchoring transpeptidase ErfK/SrfK